MLKFNALCLLVVVPLASCWPREDDSGKCAEGNSAFDKVLAGADSTKDDLIFMAEFSKFMNFKAPALLQEFAERKKIFEARRKVNYLEIHSKLYKKLFSDQELHMARAKRHSAHNEHITKSCANPVMICYDSFIQKIKLGETGSDAGTSGSDSRPDVASDSGSAPASDSGSGAASDSGSAPVSDSGSEVASDTGSAPASDSGSDTRSAPASDSGSDSGSAPASDSGSDANSDSEEMGEGEEDEDDDGKPSTPLGQAAAQFTTDLIDVVSNSTTGIIDIFTDIVSSVGGVLETAIPPTAWNYVCIATWYPLQAEHCTAAKCAVCNPAIESAKVVCIRSGLKATHSCIEKVMGEGFCNFCINDYLGN